MNQCLSLNVDADGVALVTIDVVGRPMNVLTPTFHAEFDAALDQIKSDAAIRGAVFVSAKADFMAGADLKWILASVSSIKTREQAWAFAAPLNALFRKLETLGKPMVAALNGTALGGGLELALACHYRVAAANPATRLGLPEVLVGLLPGAGGTQRLPRMIGIREALLLLVEGTHLTREVAILKQGDDTAQHHGVHVGNEVIRQLVPTLANPTPHELANAAVGDHGPHEERSILAAELSETLFECLERHGFRGDAGQREEVPLLVLRRGGTLATLLQNGGCPGAVLVSGNHDDGPS